MTATQLDLKAYYGDVSFSLERPQPETTPEGLKYTVSTDKHDLTAVVQNRLCHDSMSGLPYPFQVDIRLDGEAFNGCGGEPRQLVVGKTWRLKALGGQQWVAGQTVTLTFDRQGTLTGQAPCNRYWAIYEISGESISLRHDSTTERACSNDVMAREKHFLDMLQRIRTFRMEQEGVLVLETDRGETLEAVQLAQDSV